MSNSNVIDASKTGIFVGRATRLRRVGSDDRDNEIHLNEFKSILANRNHSIGSPNKGQSKDWTGNQQVLEETGQAGPKLARWQPYLLLPLYKDLSLHKACQVWLLLPWRRQVLLSKPWHRAKAAPLSKVLSLASLFHILLLCETWCIYSFISINSLCSRVAASH